MVNCHFGSSDVHETLQCLPLLITWSSSKNRIAHVVYKPFVTAAFGVTVLTSHFTRCPLYVQYVSWLGVSNTRSSPGHDTLYRPRYKVSINFTELYVTPTERISDHSRHILCALSPRYNPGRRHVERHLLRVNERKKQQHVNAKYTGFTGIFQILSTTGNF